MSATEMGHTGTRKGKCMIGKSSPSFENCPGITLYVGDTLLGTHVSSSSLSLRGSRKALLGAFLALRYPVLPGGGMPYGSCEGVSTDWVSTDRSLETTCYAMPGTDAAICGS
eukprot:225033-Rhodomonas_salina.10